MRSSARAAVGSARRSANAAPILRMSGRRTVERYLRRVLDAGVVILVERLFREAQRTRDQHCGEALDCQVQVADRSIVIAAGALKLALDGGQLALEVEEVLVCLKVRIGLGNGHQP